jgi:ATP-dependent Clp protease ATP-binding subunit ClpB
MDEAAKIRMEINSKPEDVLDRKVMQLEIEIEAIKKKEKDETSSNTRNGFS